MYDHDAMTQRETELMAQVATLEKSLIEANHALLLERLGTHRAEELLAAARQAVWEEAVRVAELCGDQMADAGQAAACQAVSYVLRDQARKERP